MIEIIVSLPETHKELILFLGNPKEKVEEATIPNTGLNLAQLVCMHVSIFAGNYELVVNALTELEKMDILNKGIKLTSMTSQGLLESHLTEKGKIEFSKLSKNA
jgi:hypothetical protein